ncbi:MAG: flagellar protein FlgN [Oscillospiraceae bacterium]|nr:flagellar protein FlgN [Oscillospiraceae bacterium]
MSIHNDKLYHYLNDLSDTYSDLSALMVKKAQALEEDDLYTLDEILNQEQVCVLKARGFDANIAAYRKNSGCTGETLGEIIEELPQEERRRFTELHARLSRSLETTKQLSEKCQRIAQVKLHGINRAKNEIAKAADDTPRPDKPFLKNV